MGNKEICHKKKKHPIPEEQEIGCLNERKLLQPYSCQSFSWRDPGEQSG